MQSYKKMSRYSWPGGSGRAEWKMIPSFSVVLWAVSVPEKKKADIGTKKSSPL